MLVSTLLQKVWDKGDIYKATYEGKLTATTCVVYQLVSFANLCAAAAPGLLHKVYLGLLECMACPEDFLAMTVQAIRSFLI